VGESARWLRLVRQIARATPLGERTLWDDPTLRLRVARLEMRHRALSMANYRTLAAAQLGRAPGPESSILKLAGTELLQRITELAMDTLGHAAQGWFDAPDGVLSERERWLASEFCYLRACTIYGGTNEIQRNIIAKNILQLPGT
jgi:alkylation response protein AidB-like acyl-CoA dehydrogenase